MWLLTILLLFSPPQETRGHLVLNGGGSKPASVMTKFIELAGGKDAAIVVIPTASELDDTGEYYRDLFAKDYGCTNVTWLDLKTRKDAAKPEFVQRIQAAGGVWFSGGDQRRITKAILDTPVGEAIEARYRAGGVVGGTSAGTACMSELMITGDGDFDDIKTHNIEVWQGLGLFPDAVLDQHFLARQRQNRLITVVLEHDSVSLGIGVDEGTAVWLKPDRTIEVVGDSLVQIFDARQATITQAGKVKDDQHRLAARNLRVHLLKAGETFSLD